MKRPAARSVFRVGWRVCFALFEFVQVSTEKINDV